MSVSSTETASSKPARGTLRPFSPITYLIRNLGKTAPLTLVIVLAVMLVAGIVAMMNSIPYSIRIVYSYSRFSLGISPRGDSSGTEKVIEEVKKECPVPVDRMIKCRVSGAQVKTIVGKWPFIVLGMHKNDIEYYLKRLNMSKLDGQLPRVGEPEAVISDPVARNLKLKIGSVLLSPDIQESYSPYPVKVVGIAHTDEWLMVNDFDYQDQNHFPPIDNVMVFAKNLDDQSKLDHWGEKMFKGERAQVFAYHILEKQTRDMFKTLFKILSVVIAMLVLVITFMMGMLMNIYQSQRLIEFGLLQAIGYTKRDLLIKVLRESLAVVIIGWLLGVIAAFAVLNTVKAVLMDPNAYMLDTRDALAYLYTVPIPCAIAAVALLTVAWRFYRFDPVSVVERRLL